LQDGPKIYQLAKSAGSLDVNSCYHYLLLCKKFSETCVIAAQDIDLIGFLSAFRDPKHSDTLFIWQIAVSQNKRNQGIARAILNHLLQRDFNPEIQFIETTITPSNTASQALFRSLAKEHQSEIDEQSFFEKKFFSENGHEPEHLFRIGPLTHNPKRQLYK